MQTSLYSVTIPVFIKSLQALSAILDKAMLHADTQNIEMQTILESRLAPDQFPFMKQIQLASDAAKSLAPRLNNQDPVSMPDTETTVAELKTRIDATIALLKEVKPEDVNGKEDSAVRTKWFPGKKISGFAYTTEYVLPNFFFHMTTAYSILRHNGVDIGKADFLGGLSLEEDV